MIRLSYIYLVTVLSLASSMGMEDPIQNKGTIFSNAVRRNLQTKPSEYRSLPEFKELSPAEECVRLAIEMILEALRLKEMKVASAENAFNAGQEMFAHIVCGESKKKIDMDEVIKKEDLPDPNKHTNQLLGQSISAEVIKDLPSKGTIYEVMDFLAKNVETTEKFEAFMKVADRNLTPDFTNVLLPKKSASEEDNKQLIENIRTIIKAVFEYNDGTKFKFEQFGDKNPQYLYKILTGFFEKFEPYNSEQKKGGSYNKAFEFWNLVFNHAEFYTSAYVFIKNNEGTVDATMNAICDIITGFFEYHLLGKNESLEKMNNGEKFCEKIKSEYEKSKNY